jgi:hypothetical protein
MATSSNKFYVYAHINPLKNQIFYIGKGHGKRAFSKHSRNRWWCFTVKKYGFIVNILEEGLTEAEAFEREKFYIGKIGRRDLSKGPLVNLSDGGESGSSGSTWKMTEEVKKRVSERQKGEKHFNYGKLSTTVKKLINSKGIIFDSIKIAAEYYGIKRTTLNSMLSGQNKNKTDLKYL